MTETNMNTSNPYDGDRVPGAGRTCAARCDRARSPIPIPEKRLARETIGMIEVKGPERLQRLLADCRKKTQSRIPR